MNNDLTILPIKDNFTKRKPLKRPVNPVLPDPESGFVLLLIQKIKQGKTTKIVNFVLNDAFYKDVFDNVFLISNTLNQDPSYIPIKEKYGGTCYENYSDQTIDDIIKYHKGFKDSPSEEKPRSLVILDDTANAGFKKNSASVNYLATRSRHYLNGGGLVISSQAINTINPVVRTQATAVILGKTTNKKELETIYAHYGHNFGDEETFKNMLKYATAKPYGFLYINLDKNEPHAYSNFTEQLYPQGRFGEGILGDEDST